MKTFTAVAVATILSIATAQQQYTIDPNSVSNATRQQWCISQQAQCPLICLQNANGNAGTNENNCDATSLTYACVCANGLSPNVSMYSQTLPFYICQEWGTQCVSNCGQDQTCASNCRSQHPCGAQNPVRVNTSTISSTMSGSATGGAGASTTGSGQSVFSGFAGASSTGGSGGAAASASAGGAASVRVAALNMGQTFGLLGVAGVLFGGFAIFL